MMIDFSLLIRSETSFEKPESLSFEALVKCPSGRRIQWGIGFSADSF